MRQRLNVLILVTAFAAAGCAPTLQLDPGAAATPYFIGAGGRILVETRVNGEGPYLFALDSGASISTIFEPVIDKLQLQPVPNTEVLIHGLVSSGRYPIYKLNTLELGQATWAGPRIAAIPGDTAATQQIHGLLGIDFLKLYAVGFRAGERFLYLYPPEMVAEASYRGWTTIPLDAIYFGKSRAGLYYFTVQMGDLKLPALFDLGAGENIINWPAVDKLELREIRGAPVPVLSGALDSTVVAARFRAKVVTTGRVRWLDEEFLAADLSIFKALGQEENPFVILGSGLFNQRDFVIDFARRRLLIKTSMAEVSNASAPGLDAPLTQ